LKEGDGQGKGVKATPDNKPGAIFFLKSRGTMEIDFWQDTRRDAKWRSGNLKQRAWGKPACFAHGAGWNRQRLFICVGGISIRHQTGL